MNTQDDKTEYRLFLQTVERRVSELVGKELKGEYEIVCDTVLKNNSVELDALAIREYGALSAPNIFLNPFYREYLKGMDIGSISREIVDTYLENKDRLDTRSFGSFMFEEQKDRVYFKLVNANLNRSLLEQLPHIVKGDLALIFSCLVEHGQDGIASVRIDNPLTEKWNTCPQELYELAKKNTARLFPPKIFKLNRQNMHFLLEHRMSDGGIENLLDGTEDAATGDECFKDGFPVMYVLTNTDGVDGAACIAYDGMPERIRRRLGVDFYVLPSSVHEVIILPDDKSADVQALNRMVEEINSSVVAEMDVLSNRVYHFPEDMF